MATTNDPAADQPQEKKSLFEKLFTTTPVVLTIIATLLAGLSSGEYTKGQYHRTVAGQNQSKASDQWGFFQAKAARRTLLENLLSLMPSTAKPGPITAQMLEAHVARVQKLLLQTRTRVEALKKDASAESLKAAADGYLKAMNAVELPPIPKPEGKPEKRVTKLENYLKDLETELKTNKDAFAYLGTGKLPDADKDLKPTDREKLFARQAEYTNALSDPHVKEAVKGIMDHKSEEEIGAVVLKIPPATVHTAIEASERRAAAFEKVSDPIEKQIASLALSLGSLLRLGAQYHNLVVLAEAGVLSTSEKEDDKSSKGIEEAARLDARIQSAANDLNNLFQGAAQDYNARRYRIEANNNRDTANFYELQVHRASSQSDAHRARGGYFFYGMLIAQAGVAISTIAMNARKKGLLWSIATAAGLCAISFSAYVFLKF